MNNNESPSQIEIGKKYFLVHRDHKKYPSEVPIVKASCVNLRFSKKKAVMNAEFRQAGSKAVMDQDNYHVFEKIQHVVKYLTEYYPVIS